MKAFQVLIEGEVQDLDEDVIRVVGETISQRFEGTAVRIKEVTITMKDESA